MKKLYTMKHYRFKIKKQDGDIRSFGECKITNVEDAIKYFRERFSRTAKICRYSVTFNGNTVTLTDPVDKSEEIGELIVEEIEEE